MVRQILRYRCARVVCRALVFVQIVAAVPVDASEPPVVRLYDGLTSELVVEPAPPPPSVVVNRTVPDVAPPTPGPTFSDPPTVDEIMRAQTFGEPLVPVGGMPTPEENVALARAITAYRDRGDLTWIEPLRAFLEAHPQSVWRPSLLVNLASALRDASAFSRAIEAADEAWRLTKDATDTYGRLVADLAIAESASIAVMFGQTAAVHARMEQIAGLDIRGPAGARLKRARETAAIIESAPDRVIPSGPEALKNVLKTQRGPEVTMPAALTTYVPTAAGTSLAELHELSAAAGLSMRTAGRVDAMSIPIPSVLHWKLGHFSAVVESAGGRYRLVDVALGGDRWVAEETLLDESSGYWLVPSEPSSEGWRSVTADEAATVIGHSCPIGGPAGSNPPCDDPCCPGGGASGGGASGGGGPGSGGGGGGCTTSCGRGMAAYSFNPVNAALQIWDIPVGYQPARGAEINFKITYSHREEQQPQMPTYSNLGPMWSHNWLRFIKEQPVACGQTCEAAYVWVYLPGGGRDVFSQPDAQGVYPLHWRTQAVLVRTSTSPLRYEHRLADGTVEVYAQPDHGLIGQQRVFLTEIIDPRGQSTTLTYDAQLRLMAIRDALGQVTTFEYAHPTDPLKITKVTDPFSRFATFTYTPAGQLASATDVIGLTSSFAYDAGDFIASMTTPYGVTTFRQEPWQVGGNFTRRFIEATNPLGHTQHLEYRWHEPTLASTAPATDVPAGFEWWNTGLDYYNTFYWDARAWADGPNDLTKATVTRWVSKEEYPGATPYATPVPHSVKKPLEGRMWYRYAGQVGDLLGPLGEPSHTGRVLDNGTSQITETTYTAQGRVLTKTDPVGRRRSYTYAANGTDLLEVRNTTGTLNDLLASYGNYTAHGQPQSVTDAAGQTTTMTYNAAGQVLTVTNPKQETTTYAYDADGRLQSVTAAVPGATTTYTYDAYGRVRTVTNADGSTVTTDYDLFDRPTRVTDPDGTYEAFTYDRLHKATSRDRLGRTTRYYYDPLQRLVATRDPLGRVIRQEYEPLARLIDANGQATAWEKDLQGRTTREVRADGVAATTYTYEAKTSRLKQSTDPKQQTTHYAYAVDDATSAISFTNAQIATPSVSYVYDPSYARVTSMVDGTGTTQYTYHPAGQAGGGKIASVDGPLPNDTITYTYDQLGRVTTRAINGVGITWGFDALGRVTSEANVLGTFGYTYDGHAGRVATVTYPNGQTSAYTYFPTAQDHRLQTIHHRYPNGATLSKFDYTYDVVGNILTWRQQADNDAVIWTYGYDTADQLIAAVKNATDPQGTLLKRYLYTYDPAGNRTAEQVDDVVTGASHDSLNRLLSHQAAGPIQVAGTVSEPATVMIDGTRATVTGSNAFTGAKALVTGGNMFTVTATDPSGNATSAAFDLDSTAPSRTFTYDANGNLTADGTRTFEWDARNQLVAVNTGMHRSEFTYDSQQRRVRLVEKDNGFTQSDTRVIWCDNTICEERAGDGITVTLRGFKRGEQAADIERFFTTDHLGSVTEVSDGMGVVLARYGFDPWGRRILTAGNDLTAVTFTGHYLHRSSMLTLTPTRVYDIEVGRWLSQDSGYQHDGPNLYAYVRNRPLAFIDPDGRSAAAAVLGAEKGAAAGAVVGGPAGAVVGGVIGAAAGLLIGLAVCKVIPFPKRDRPKEKCIFQRMERTIYGNTVCMYQCPSGPLAYESDTGCPPILEF